MTRGSSAFAVLSSRNELASRLAAVCARSRLQTVSIGLRLEDRTLFAQTDNHGAIRAIEPGECSYAPAGCLTKTLTATLLAEAVGAGKVDWSTEVTEILGIRG